MKRPRGPYKNNVVGIFDALKTVELKLRCTLCKMEYLEKVPVKMKPENIRCPRCINPVDLVEED